MGNLAYRKSDFGETFSSFSHLLPTLAASAPMVSSIFGLLKGESKSDTTNTSLQGVLPRLAHSLSQVDPHVLGVLLAQVSNAVPELEGLLNKKE